MNVSQAKSVPLTRRCCSGLSLLEFTLATLMISVLIVLAFQRIAALRVDIERAQIEHTVGAMRAALALELAALVVRGQLQRLPGYAGTNALDMLSPAPADYAGSVGEGATTPAPGSWFFARTAGAVVYRPRHPEALGAGEPVERLRWRVVPVWHDADNDGAYDPRVDGAPGLMLEALDEPHWRQRP